MSNKKFVVFTVIVGGYDSIKQPTVIDNRFDYILFSDAVEEIETNGVWKVMPIRFKSDKLWLTARYPRLTLDPVFYEYQASLYIDGSIQITSKHIYDRCVELANRGVEWGGAKHPSRNCIYDEMNAIIGLGWVHDYEVLDWYLFLKKEGFPNNFGLFETGLIFRLHTDTVRNVCSMWWHSLEKFSLRRDQFCLMYAIWQGKNLNTCEFFFNGQTIWNNDGWLSIESHRKNNRLLNKTLWEKLRDRYVRKFYWNGGWEVYYTHWFDKLLKHPFPHLAMHFWTAWVLVRYDLKFMAGRAWQRIIGKDNNYVGDE